MRPLLLLFFILFLGACSEYQGVLDRLGTMNSFNDVEIPNDFEAPEDEVETPQTEPDPDSGVVEITPPIPTINFKNTFHLDDQSFSLAHGPAKRWDGCQTDKESQGGYNSDSRCGRAFFHPSFADNLNDAFFICVSDAAEEAGFPQPVKVFVRHIGSYNDRTARNSSRLSNHAYARAWDIVNFNLFDVEGKRYKVSTYLRDYEGAQAKFYDEFRQCWMESLPSRCVAGQTEYKGSVGHQASELGGNSLHNDHLHLSYPLCAGNS